jgi:hypothetical protein
MTMAFGFEVIFLGTKKYSQTLVHARDKDQNFRLEYNESTYKKTKDTYILRIWFLKKDQLSITLT